VGRGALNRPLADGASTADDACTFALLVSERHRAVTRDELANTLWAGAPPPTWEPALRGVVGRVRAYLVDAGLGAQELLRTEAGSYHLGPLTETEVDIEVAAALHLLPIDEFIALARSRVTRSMTVDERHRYLPASLEDRERVRASTWRERSMRGPARHGPDDQADPRA
jgi:DNA-binding SARP family transcriptional activator